MSLIMPPGYTVKKLLLGWLMHFLIACAIAWVFGFAVAVFFYAAREAEWVFNRLRKGRDVRWIKSGIDVLAAVAGAVLVSWRFP